MTTEPITLTIGVPGDSDVILVELEHAAEHFGLSLHETTILLIGMGLGTCHERGLFQRVTSPGRGVDPTPLSDEEIGQ